MRLTEAIEALLISTKADGLSDATYRGYQVNLKPLVTFLGDVDVDLVTTQDIRRYIGHLRDLTSRYQEHPKHEPMSGGLSPFTVASYVTALRRLFNWLCDESLITANPTERIRFQPPRRTEPKGIAMDDLRRLLETTSSGSIADRRDAAIMLFLADTGCRVGGLVRLSRQDLNMVRRLAILTEKGSKTRMVPFSQPTAEALDRWLEIRGFYTASGPWLWITIDGYGEEPMTANAVAQMLKRRARDAGVTGPVNPHAFRHAFAREFLLNGGDLASLADLLGHADVQVTKASYAIFTISDLQEKHRKHSPVAVMFGGDE